MLELRKISKKYITGSLVQNALDKVSVTFRDNEFVSILGPSGSGKSTLLNIIGGLDSYDSGELLIDSVSTEKYKSRDWDSYRNHQVGFVFQSYNLISHQSVLANVELALTISGISKDKRKKLAIDALDKVGLKEHIHKKPNQLSGGQMQRVAIARALVNNPKILLADEPTGALDSETSIQVMELLKEVAKDRLVVMVTHNPELAHNYSTRIVELRDGKIISDTDPYTIAKKGKAVHKNFGKASMSYLTSISLSFNNLKTKFKRTLMVAFAGSIGIIGIALILALSNGVNKFINDTEEETMISYPVQITESSFSFMTDMVSFNDVNKENENGVEELKTLQNMLSVFSQNDLGSLKRYFEGDGKEINNYAKSVEYYYEINPIIFVKEKDSYTKVNPNETFRSLGLGSDNILFSNMSINAFNKLPKNSDLYEEKFTLKAGSWPKNKNECIVITNSNGNLSDFVFYSLGLKDSEELEQMIDNFANKKSNSFSNDIKIWNYSDIIGINFKVVSPSYLYKYDDTNNVYIDKSNDTDYINSYLNNNGINMKVVGIATPNEDEDSTLLRQGIWYTDELIKFLRVDATNSEVFKAQQKNKDINVLTNGPFGEKQSNSLDFASMFSIDEKAISSAFNIDTKKLNINTSSLTNMDLSKYSYLFNNITVDSDFLKDLDIRINENELNNLMNNITTGFLTYSQSDPTTNYVELPTAIRNYISSDDGRAIITNFLNRMIQDNAVVSIDNERIRSIITNIMSGYQDYIIDNGYTDPTRFNEYLEEYLNSSYASNIIESEMRSLLSDIINNINITDEQSQELANELEQGYIVYARNNNLPDPTKMEESFRNYLATDEAKQMISTGIYNSVNVDDIKKQIEDHSNSESNSLVKQMNNIINKIMSDIGKKVENVIIDSAKSLPNAISVDQDKFAKAFVFNMNEEDIKSFIMAVSSNRESSYENNLKTFGYVEEDHVSEIDIYPKDFESKNSILELLDNYNKLQKELGKTENMINYTDLVGVMMASITTIVNVISYVLIAFVAISLIVSSIMIGVITYISVLERKKEIGILRAIGASKKNISEVFNAETGIIGLFAGLLGVIISILITIPANYILRKITDIPTLTAYLRIEECVILILISVVLTLIGGLIPSRSAARQDPVESLRTE